jgi:hypothetical protein
MTVVACISDHGNVLLVADTLVSAETARPRTRQVLSGGMIVEVEDQAEREMHEDQLKLARIGPVGIGYSGRVSKGRAAFELLHAEHQRTRITSVEELGRLLLQQIVPSVTGPGDIDISLCGFFVGAMGVTKFACVTDGQGIHRFTTSADSEQGCFIGGGAREFEAELPPEQETTTESRGHLLIGLERVLRPIYRRQIVRDKLFLKRGVGGAVVALYTDGKEIHWQPSRTEVVATWLEGYGVNAKYAELDYAHKTYVEADTLFSTFMAAEGGQRLVHYRLLANPLSRLSPTTARPVKTFNSSLTAITVLLPGWQSDPHRSVTELKPNQDASFFDETWENGEIRTVGFKHSLEPTLRRVYLHENGTFLFGVDALHMAIRDHRAAMDRHTGSDREHHMWQLAYRFTDIGEIYGDAQSIAMAVALAAEIDSPDLHHSEAIERALRVRLRGVGELLERASGMAYAKQYDPEYRRTWFYVCPYCNVECLTHYTQPDGRMNTAIHRPVGIRSAASDQERRIECGDCGRAGTPVNAMWLQFVLTGESGADGGTGN